MELQVLTGDSRPVQCHWQPWSLDRGMSLSPTYGNNAREMCIRSSHTWMVVSHSRWDFLHTFNTLGLDYSWCRWYMHLTNHIFWQKNEYSQFEPYARKKIVTEISDLGFIFVHIQIPPISYVSQNTHSTAVATLKLWYPWGYSPATASRSTVHTDTQLLKSTLKVSLKVLKLELATATFTILHFIQPT